MRPSIPCPERPVFGMEMRSAAFVCALRSRGHLCPDGAFLVAILESLNSSCRSRSVQKREVTPNKERNKKKTKKAR